MAAINIIPPRYGTIEVLDSSLSNYRVQYVPPPDAAPGDVEFNGFKVFCHACRQYLYTTSPGVTTATFDIQHLLDTGHPGDFDISADTSAEIDFLVATESADPNMGTTTPVEQWIPVQAGHYASYTIKAVPLDGYEFVKWVSSTGSEFTDATKSFSTQVNYGDPGYRYYTAYFRKKTVKVYVRIKGTGVVQTSDSSYPTADPRYVYTYSGNVQIATVSPGYIEAATVFEPFTMTMSWLPAASQYNAKFLGFKVVRGTREDGMLFEADSVTATPDGTESVIVEAWFCLGVVITVRFVDPRYVNMNRVESSAGLVRIGSASGSTLSSVGGGSTEDSVNGVVKFTVPSSRAPSSLYMRYFNGWIANALAFLHGTSSPRCAFINSLYVKIDFGTEDEEYFVYVCTHRLMYGALDKLLYGSTGRLLYDCSVPPGTAVYD